ncbi:hypothetical protein, partial [Halochromatium roseum]|uniref:hypothetical protein n=1 Tax=Halochromatium roseum TaxID=391920 RepID=UPI001911E19E
GRAAPSIRKIPRKTAFFAKIASFFDPEGDQKAILFVKSDRLLERLFERLRALRSSPVNARDIGDLGELVKLAREVGVLSVYEGTEDQVERFKVPDIYLAGLGIT